MTASMVMLAGFLTAATAQADMPAAGTSIDNRAEASYYHTTLAGFETVYSNTTSTIVDPVKGVELTSDLFRTVAPGSPIEMPHRLTNTGNVTASYVLTAVNLQGDEYDVANIAIWIDAHANGFEDGARTRYAPGDILTLAAGASLDLRWTGQVPGSTLNGQLAYAEMTATIIGTDLAASVTDTIAVGTRASISLRKSASANIATAGETIGFGILASNNGNAPMQGIDIEIDGITESHIIIRDRIPVSTWFSGITETGAGFALYHVAGDPQDSYRRTRPSEAGLIDAIAFAFDELAPGSSIAVGFSVTVNANGGREVRNTAQGHFATGGDTVVTDSNTVLVGLPSATATMLFMNEEYTDMAAVASAGDDLFIGIDAAMCNTDAAVAETYPISVRTELSRDRELNLVVVETGPNTGIFTLQSISTLAWPMKPQIGGNDIVEVARNDVVVATMESCPGIVVESRILIDPAGIVFDSRTNAPIPNATVTLFGVNADGSEYVPEVFDRQGNPVSNQFVSDANGYYEFPLVPPGDYRLIVTPPNGYLAPSTFPTTLLSTARRIDSSGSYAGPFPVSLVTGPVFLDIPLDPTGLSGLFVEKTASRTVIEVGESLLYTLRITNNTGFDLFDVRLEDELPTGFVMLPGTARLDNVAQENPAGMPGARLTFELDHMTIGQVMNLSYRVRVTHGALRGNGINSAQAINDNAESNIATATVSVADSVFSDKGFIAGKIFVDCDQNRYQDPGDLGIPGVRLFLEDGTFVVSDAEGKYSFAGLQATTHVLKVDRTTLPHGAEMTTLSNRNAGDAQSVFVDMKRGELQRADFAEGSCADAVIAQVKERRSEGAVLVAEVEQRLQFDLQAQDRPANVDPRTRPASGVIGSDGRISDFTSLLGTRKTPTITTLSGLAARTVPSIDLETVIEGLDPELDFIDLRDGDTVAGTQINVRVKGAAETKFHLSVNGEALADKRVGQRVGLRATGVQAWEYVAVRLEPGENHLRAVQIDGFGNPRGSKEIRIVAPGALGELRILAPGDGAAADGHTPVPLLIRLVDNRGISVTARTAVTLEATIGRWDVEDLDPREPGVQAFIEGGEAIFDLMPPDVPGESLIRVTSGALETSEAFGFLPDLRPLIVAGVIDGAIGINKLSQDELTAPALNDGFEETIGGFRFSGDNKLNAGARAALYLKGKIRGDRLLTMSYDSDRDTRDRLFRDIRPDEFYPVYGDSAVKGFDAQSSGKLYLRIDKGRSYFLYGDYQTKGDSEARRLGNYSRSFNGAQAHLESVNASINLFASYDYFRQAVEEIRARGVSGPYVLNNTNMIRQSETVEIVIRDRDQPALVIETRTMTRFVDYSLDFFTGDLIFRQPIASIDADLNPVFIRVSYETGNGGDRFWVYGVDAQLRLGENLELGTAYVNDADPINEYRIMSANATYRINDETHVLTEIARSEAEVEGSGNAMRVELTHRTTDLDVHVFGVQSDTDFLNPSAPVTAGRNESGAKISWNASRKTRLRGELLRTEDRTNNGVRSGGLVGIERLLENNLRIELGARYVRETDEPALESSAGTTPRHVASARTRLTWQPPSLPELNLFGEYEQELGNAENRVATIGGDYQLMNRGRVYLRHELISSASGPFGLSEFANQNQNTSLGFDFDYMRDGHLFSEYRVRDVISGAEAEAVMGVRNAWQISDGLRVQGGFERIAALSGDGSDSMAATGGFDYLVADRWKSTGRLEYRRSDRDTGILATLGAARKLSRSWSLLGQGTVFVRKDSDSGLRNTDARIRVGAAYRSTDDNRWNALGRYEFKLGDDELLGDKRQVHLWSMHANFHPTRAWTFNGRYAGKRVAESGMDYVNDYRAHLISARATYDVTERLDLGLIAATIFSGDARTLGRQLGMELGYLVASNVWLSAGYNHFGYEDADLPEDDYTNPGVFIRVRFKFDEDMFGWLQRN